jgi:Tol biopolymer transport system component
MASRRIFTAAGLIVAVTLAAPRSAGAQSATRVSVASDGHEGNGPSFPGGISSNGRFVVFSSDATNLVPGDTNGMTDVFWHDRSTGETRRVSVDGAGGQANGRSFAGAVSKNGRLVVFWSHATNLVAGDTNGVEDVFLHDTVLHATTRLTMGMDGVQTNGGNRFPTMSDDGRFVAFESFATNIVPGDSNNRADIILLDRRSGQFRRIGQPPVGESNGDNLRPQITPNGRFLAFESSSSNLVPGDTNGTIDAFVVDLTRNTLACASVGDAGVIGDLQSRGPVASDNGRWVTFLSLADNLVPGDTNGQSDSFIRDTPRGPTRRVSVDSNGIQGNGGSNGGRVDPNGRFVAFSSLATNLVAGDGNGVFDVFVHDLTRGTTVRVTKAADGGETNGATSPIAFVGRSLFVGSVAGNLVPGDTNSTDDLFLIPWR